MPVLSDARIRALKPTEKPYKKADFDGLYLLVKPNGSKLWRFKYRWHQKEKLLALGKYPEVTLADARRRRDDARSLIASGEDPSSVRKDQKAREATEQDATFSKLAAELLEKKRREGRAKATLSKTEWFHRLLCADIGQMPITQITARDILIPLQKIEKKGNHESAIRMRSAAGAVFRYAIALGLADNDPTYGLKDALIRPQVQHRAAITDPAQVGSLLRAIDGFTGQRSTRLALQLLSQTALRPGELRMAEWEEIDESNGEPPAYTGNKSDSRGTVWYPTNDRIVHEWQTYAGRFEVATMRAHLRSIRMLEACLGGKAFDKVTPKDAAAFRDHLVELGQTPKERGGLSSSTIRHHASQVRQFFEWLRLQDGYKRLSQNILLNLELPKASRAKTLPRDDRDYLTIEEAQGMLEKMPERTIGERRDRAMVACAYTSGLRAAALTTLRLKHIDLVKKEVVQDATEMRAKNGKSFRSYFFPRTEAFQQVLTDWFSELVVLGFTKDDAVFPELTYLQSRAPDASPVPPMQSSAAVGNAFDNATSLIGRNCTPHSARDTLKVLGDELSNSPRDRKALSLNLGHTTEKIMETYYGKMSDQQRRNIIEGLAAGSLLTAKENAMVLDFYESRFERGSAEYNMAKRLADKRAAARDGGEVVE